jgi:hypothetical protein
VILAKLPSAQRGSEPVIIALGEKVFGALLAIAGAAIILTSHWATTDDMIAGPDRRSVDAGVWSYGLTDVELSALTAALAVEEMETQWARAKPPEQRDGNIG